MMSEDRLALAALEDPDLGLEDRGLVSGDRDLDLADRGSVLASDVRLDLEDRLVLADRLDFIRLDLVFRSLADFSEDSR